jgi:EpsI family protein
MSGPPAFSRRSFLVVGSLFASAGVARLITPTLHAIDHEPDLEQALPQHIDDWQMVASPLIQVGVSVDNSPNTDQPYNQSILRTYANTRGELIQLAVAWGRQQRQEVKIHRPELCYPAQGFRVLNLQDTTFPVRTPAGLPIIGKRMLTQDRNGQLEAVSYWIRIGGIYSDNAWRTRLHIVQEGLAGRIPDGVLVRVSQRIPQGTDLAPIYQRQEAFAARLVALTNAGARALLVR